MCMCMVLTKIHFIVSIGDNPLNILWNVIISNYYYFSNACWILVRFNTGLNKYINLCIVIMHLKF